MNKGNLKSQFDMAVLDPTNLRNNGDPEWNYVDADCYASHRGRFGSDDAFYAAFDALCDAYIASHDPV